jgi:hypothetical protein
MAEVPKKLDPKDFPINLPHHSSSWSRRKEALAKKVSMYQLVPYYYVDYPLCAITAILKFEIDYSNERLAPKYLQKF